MSKDARDEFLTGLAQALDTYLADDTRPSRHQLRAALDTATQGWKVTRKGYPRRDDHPLKEPRYGHKLVATGPFIPETDTEIADREARNAARSCGSQWYPCAHGGTRDSDYCSACEQE